MKLWGCVKIKGAKIKGAQNFKGNKVYGFAPIRLDEFLRICYRKSRGKLFSNERCLDLVLIHIFFL